MPVDVHTPDTDVALVVLQIAEWFCPATSGKGVRVKVIVGGAGTVVSVST